MKKEAERIGKCLYVLEKFRDTERGGGQMDIQLLTLLRSVRRVTFRKKKGERSGFS